jgi:hypothetical protein
MVNLQNGVYPDASSQGIDDTRIQNNNPNTNYDTFVNAVGPFSPTLLYRSILRFGIDSYLPIGAKINKAYLTLTVNSIDGSIAITAYAIDQYWIVSEATWNTANTTPSIVAWATPGVSHAATSKSDTAVVAASNYTDGDTFTIHLDTAMVQSWLDSPAANYGILLKAANETTGPNRLNIYNSEIGATNYRPRLTVYYTAP